MKKTSTFLLLALCVGVLAAAPAETFAKRGGDDDSGQHGRHRDSNHDDESTDDSNSNNTNNHTLEVEADVFTDITIVKVELSNGRKVIFETTADTRGEVVTEIVNKLDLNETTVEAILDFEIEDRASRAKDRAGVRSENSSNQNVQSLRAQITSLQNLIERLLAKLAEAN